MLSKTNAIAAVAALTLGAGAANAATDPLGDFLATYAGPTSAGLDIVSVDARLNGGVFNLTATMSGPIQTLPNILYVWGVNRGQGTARLNLLSTPPLDPTVKFDALAVQLTNGTLLAVQVQPAGPPIATPIPGAVTINGSTITTSVPLALWPANGFAPTSYTFQLWSRFRVNPAADGLNTEIADFGPRIFASVPEPASWAMMIGGFGLAGWAARRRGRAAFA